MYIYDHISLSSYNEKCFIQKLLRKFYVKKFLFKNRVVYGIMWKNIVLYSRTGHRWQYGAWHCMLDT